jgi:citrate synthase
MSTTGLEGVVVADTWLSDIDGDAGRLLIAGVPIERLAPCGFSTVTCLLSSTSAGGQAAAPLPVTLTGLRFREAEAALGRARGEAFEVVGTLGGALRMSRAMHGLRAAMAQLAVEGDDAVRVIGAVPVFVAAWWRHHRGLAPVAPDPSVGHAADYLRMLRGEPPSEAEARALDCYLATVAEHGMNASSFAARVVASTAADLVSSIVAAIGALDGRLHGGAPGPVLDMLDAIGTPERAEPWLRDRLEGGERIMGMGHRVYRRRDPRAEVLEAVLRDLAGETPRVRLARHVEHTAQRILAERHPDRPLCANVELFTALLLEALAIDRELFTATFAMGRVVGWCAHVAEQRRGRLLRPRARYVGRPAHFDGTDLFADAPVLSG